MAEDAPAFEGWAVLELLGHRRLAGWVSEETFAGTAFIRLDVPANEGEPGATYDPDQQAYVATQLYSAAALYCLTPTTKEMVLAVARHNRPAPVQRWELPPASQDGSEPVPDYEDVEF